MPPSLPYHLSEDARVTTVLSDPEFDERPKVRIHKRPVNVVNLICDSSLARFAQLKTSKRLKDEDPSGERSVPRVRPRVEGAGRCFAPVVFSRFASACSRLRWEWSFGEERTGRGTMDGTD